MDVRDFPLRGLRKKSVMEITVITEIMEIMITMTRRYLYNRMWELCNFYSEYCKYNHYFAV